ncbi:MAG: DUF6414 family protein [Bifidobacterium crudilactis]|uniref:DUF6414 family protein n=1 Tax=Bifidobacterium crudilactis TaxID=327277 RepID=UPI003F973383
MTRPKKKQQRETASLIKIVYFDEQSASDYLDISAGGKLVTATEDQKDKTSELQAHAGARIAARLSWIPLFGAQADASAEAEISRNTSSLLRQTLSNTVLTDYLPQADQDSNIEKMRDYSVSIPPNTFTYVKVFTPYMQIANTKDTGIDLAKLDAALLSAKGYYELLAMKAQSQEKAILRFNIRAFRNSYGLADLTKMNLVYYAVKVGEAKENELDITHELPHDSETTPADLINHKSDTASKASDSLSVYDVILAGVEHEK